MTNPTTSDVALRTARNISLDCLRLVQSHLPSQAKTVAIAAIASGVALSNSSTVISNLSFVIAAGAAIVHYTGKEQQVKAAIATLIQSRKNVLTETTETVTRMAIIKEEYNSFTTLLKNNPEITEHRL
ncbi:MAG: hypothetical protein RLZZ453_922 [Chlamydiota bacterium]|jgi:tRNA C32,U32 (ribose-2'-O)-methylase TrmJ